MLYRVKQFYWDITSRLKKPEYAFISKYLNIEELELFKELSISEQFHCIRVANNATMYAKKSYNLNEYELSKLIKICLLHDIGKTNVKINVFEKSIFVIFDKLSKGKLRSFSKTNEKINSYYFHAEKGASILSKMGYSKDIVYIVKNHHRKVNDDNIFLNILKYSDNIS